MISRLQPVLGADQRRSREMPVNGHEELDSILTTNKAYKNWPEIFSHDAGMTSAILDRVLHHAETMVIEGKSFRMKDQIEPSA